MARPDVVTTLDQDMLYPLPNKVGGLIAHKHPRDFNRKERRAVDAIVERCERAGVPHPYVARMRD
jgi:hypothetical protein